MGKILFLLFLLAFVGTVAALEPISDVPYSGHINSVGCWGYVWDEPQIYYQKFKIDNETIYIYQIQLYLPNNTTSAPKDIGGQTWLETYLRIGISDIIPSVTPIQFYPLDVTEKFKCYADRWKWKYRGGFVNFTLTATGSNRYFEPNTENYITWFVYAGGDDVSPLVVYMPRGTTPAAWSADWSQHRGNVTSAVWTDPWTNYNLSYVLWGTKMSIATAFSSYTGGTGTDAKENVVYESEINGGSAYGRNWTYGMYFGNATCNYDSFEINTTCETNSTDYDSGATYTDLTPGKFYHIRGWLMKNGSYPVIFGDEDYYLTHPLPPSNLTEISRDQNYIHLRWDNGTYMDGLEMNETGLRSVLWKSNTEFVVNPLLPPADAVIVFNGTTNETNVTVGSEFCYFTAFSFMQHTEDGETLTQWSLSGANNYSVPATLNYNVILKNEKPPYGNYTVTTTYANQTYEFADKEHNAVLMNPLTISSFTVYCNLSNIINVRTATSPDGNILERNMIIPQSNNSDDRNISVYIPNAKNGTNKGDIRPVTISFIDQTSGHFTVDKHAIGIIKKLIDNKTVTVHSDYLQADLAIRTFMVIGDQYYFYAKSDDLEETRLGGILIYDEAYTINVMKESITNSTWRNYVTLTSGWTGGPGESKTLYLTLLDTSQGLYKTTVRLYNSSGTQKKSLNYTSATSPKSYDFTFTYNTGDINKSAYYANIYMQYHKGKTWWNDSTNYFWDSDTSGMEIDVDVLNSYLDDILGESFIYIPATDSTPEITIPYGTLIAAGIVIMFFFVFTPAQSAFALIFLSFILAMIRMFNLISETLLPSFTIGIIAFLGILLLAVKFKKRGGD